MAVFSKNRRQCLVCGRWIGQVASRSGMRKEGLSYMTKPGTLNISGLELHLPETGVIGIGTLPEL